MLVPTVLAALAALPAIRAQSTASTTAVSNTATRCTTRYGFNPLPTGTAGAPTWFSFTTTTSQYRVTTTTREVITVTPSATTLTDVVTTSTTITTTSTTTPAPTTIPAPSGFLPLVVVNIASATAAPIPRMKRYELDGRSAELLPMLKRQTPAGNTGGFIAYPNGTTSNLYRRYPHRVDCRVTVTVDETVAIVVQGAPETSTALQNTATAVSFVTRSVTTVVTETAPRPTVYAACRGNNVVSKITDIDGNNLFFDRIIYRPDEGFPVQNELVVDTTSAVNCCIACQNTPFCAGSFYAPGDGECHLRLTQPITPPSNATLAIGNGTLPSNTTVLTPTASGAIIPISTGVAGAGNGTCARGPLSLYLGTIRGQDEFPEEYALSFSNGPCGRFSVSPIPVPVEWPGPVKKRAPIPVGMVKRWTVGM